MRFSILTAVSTASQATEDKASLSEQETKCRAVGTSRGWVESSGPYVIPGKSRTRFVNLRDAEAEIPALRTMLEDGKHGRYDVLMLFDYNRLRDLIDPVAKTLGAYGIQLFSVNQPVDPIPPQEFSPYASDTEPMVRGINQIISRWTISDLRRKYYFGVSARVRSGLPSIRIPYGYSKPPGREQDTKAVPIQVPSHARVVIEIKEMFLNGTSYYGIRDCLNERGTPTPEGAKGWSHSTVKKILRNPFYAGKVFFQRYRTKRDPNSASKARVVLNADHLIEDGAHVGLYSWDDYQSILAEFKRREGFPHNNRYPFSGLLVCSVCGARLCHDHGSWRCKLKGTKKDHIGLRVEEALALVPRALQRALRDVSPADPSPSSTAVLQGEDTTTLERQRRRVQQAYESEVYSLEEAEAKIKAIDIQIRDLKDGEAVRLRKQKEREQFMLTLDQAREILEFLPRWCAEQDPKTVNYFLLRLCRSVTVTPDGVITVQLRD